MLIDQKLTTKTDGTSEVSATEHLEDTANDSILTMELPPVSDIDESYESAPEPEPEAETPLVNSTKEETESAADKLRGALDDKGQAYDPAVHSFPAEKTPTGKWKKVSKAKLAEKPAEEIAEQSNAAVRLEAQKAAMLYAGIHQGVFGAENGKPSNPAYVAMLIDSFERYMLENGVTKMPAGADALLTMGMFSIDVATKPRNAQKVKGWFSGSFKWIKNKFNKKGAVPRETISANETGPKSA